MHTSKKISKRGFTGPGRFRTNGPWYPPIRRVLLGVTSPAIAPRIGAARDAEERMLKWSEGMEPRFISWNIAAMHTFDFTFHDAWSRKKIKAPTSRRSEVRGMMCIHPQMTCHD